MITVDEIKKVRDYLVTDLHSDRLKEQMEDQRYYNDTFSLPLIKDEEYIVRTGAAARLVDNITEQIISSNPQVFRKPHKDTASAKNASANVVSLLNEVAQYLNLCNPNRYKEAFKNQLVAGEVWMYVIHNTSFNPEDYPNSMPFDIMIPHPHVVFYDPREGETGGVPNRVIVDFERSVTDLQLVYPHFIPDTREKKVPFLMYIDNDVRYFEANKQPLLVDKNGEPVNGTGIQKNIYGFPPLVHAYSGFGKESPDGNPASLAVGRLRKIRGIIREETTIRSNISFIIHKYAHPHIDIINKSGVPISEEQLNEYDFGAGIIQEIMMPEGAEMMEREGLAPAKELLQYFGIIRSDLVSEDPPSMRGLATGTSGRQEDVLRNTGLKLYDSVIYNTSNAFATAMGLGLRMCEKLPNLLPRSVSKSDIDGDYNCTLELRAEDPIEKDRLSVAGRAMVQAGQLSLKTNLMKYQGLTEEQADDEIDQILAERYMFQSPEIAELMQIRAAEKAGMLDDVELLQNRRKQLEKQIGQFPLGLQFGSQGGEPRTGNIQTPTGMEMADVGMTQGGIRSAPR